MGTRRYAQIVYGYSIPCKDFEIAEELKSNGIDSVVDGMSGEYFLVGKLLVSVSLDSYEDTDDCSTPVEVSLSVDQKLALRKKLLPFLERLGIPPRSPMKTFYVTHYV